MSDTDHNNDIDRKLEFARIFMLKDRPLPTRGCSWACVIFLVHLTAGLAFMYLFYKQS